MKIRGRRRELVLVQGRRGRRRRQRVLRRGRGREAPTQAPGPGGCGRTAADIRRPSHGRGWRQAGLRELVGLGHSGALVTQGWLLVLQQNNHSVKFPLKGEVCLPRGRGVGEPPFHRPWDYSSGGCSLASSSWLCITVTSNGPSHYYQ